MRSSSFCRRSGKHQRSLLKCFTGSTIRLLIMSASGREENTAVTHAILGVVLLSAGHRPLSADAIAIFLRHVTASSVKSGNRYYTRLAHFMRCPMKTATPLSESCARFFSIICRESWLADTRYSAMKCIHSCFEARLRQCTAVSSSTSVSWRTHTKRKQRRTRSRLLNP